MSEGKDLSIAELCAHTGWMRALARRLVEDEALADDLVQESLLRAVERPPGRPGAMGSWLRTVLSRLAIRARQEARSRRRRELAAARPERSGSTPAELLERVELQSELVKLVLALREPCRSAVLLSYFQGWSAQEIARRQGVDVTTIRWRLRKALQLLRARLERLHGSRTAWCAALAPLLVSGRGAEAAALPPSGGAGAASSITLTAHRLLGGVALMKLKSLAIAFVLTLCLLGFFLYLVRELHAAPEIPPASAPSAVVASRPAPPPPAAPVEATRAVETRTEPGSIPPPPPGLAIVGLVSEAESDEPLPGAVVRVRGSSARAVAGEDGRYRLEGLPVGEHYLVAAARGHAEEHARAHLEGEGEFLQDFRLEAAVDLLVTVSDADGKPLEAVGVTAAQPSGDYLRGDEYTRFTDREGKAVLSGIGRQRRQQVNARKDGYREVWSRDYRIDPEEDQAALAIVMERRLEGEAVVVGQVTGPGGAPLPDIHVQWIHSHGEDRGRVVVETGRDGSYRLQFPREGDWCAVSAFGQGFAPSIHEGVRPGNAESPARVDFTLQAGHRLEGQVIDEEDRPVAGAKLLALPTIYNLRNTPLHAGNLSQALTDERGRFALENLSAPTTALRVQGPPGAEWGNNYHPQVEVDRQITLRLLRWGLIRGRVLDRETGEPVQVFGIKLKKGAGYYDYPRADPGEFFNSAQGLFVLQKLDQGPLEFLVEAEGYIPRWIRDAAAKPDEEAPLEEVRITRGRSLEGTVVDGAGGAPLSGARVIFGAWEGDLAWDEGGFRKVVDLQDVVTGPDGAFQVREGEPGTLFVRRAGYGRLALGPSGWKKLLDPSGRLRVALARGTALSGVLFEDGKPSRGGFLVLYSRRPWEGAEGREWIGNLDRDAQGRFRVEDLTPGDYFLEHWRETPGKRTAGLSIQRPLFLEAEKENLIEFGADLGPLAFQGRLLSRNGTPLARARFTLRPEFECAYSEFAASVDAEHEGRFHLLGLQPGKYRAEVIDRAGKRISLEPVEIETDLERDLVTELGQ